MNHIVFNERNPLLNPWSASTMGIILLAATALAMPGAPGAGARVGMAIVVILATYIVVTMLRCRVIVSRHDLVVGVFPFRKRLPLSDLECIAAVLLSPGEDPNTRWRKNGIGLPGMQLGWFTTSRGKPVFAATAGSDGRVFIPTRTSHDLLISPRHPERLIEALHSLSSKPRGIASEVGGPSA